MRIWILGVIWLVLGSAAAVAEPVPGSDHPAFIAARADWLTGSDDLTALRALGDLARQGDTAAQILLARISERTILHRHVTAALDRDARIALLRQPGGLSGRSWLEAARDDPLAQTFWTGAMAEGRALALPRLLEAGEWAAALIVVQDMLNRAQTAQVLTALGPFLSDGPAVLSDVAARAAWLEHRFSGGEGGPLSHQTLSVQRAALLYRPPSAARLLSDPRAVQEAADLISGFAPFTPLHQFCAAHCGRQQQACLAIGVSATHVSGALPFRSPSERLVPNALYWGSGRIEGDVLRILAAGRLTLELLRPVDTCLADVVAASTP